MSATDNDLHGKLTEASKLFSVGKFQACDDVMKKLPQSDPKVIANAAILEYAWHGGSYNKVLSGLGYEEGANGTGLASASGGVNGTSGGSSASKQALGGQLLALLNGGAGDSASDLSNLSGEATNGSGATASSQSLLCLDYEGHEVAMLNQCVVLLYNAEGLKAIPLLANLARCSSSLEPVLQVRLAVLIRLATKPVGGFPPGLQQRKDVLDELYQKAVEILKMHQDVIAKNEELTRMVALGTSDRAGLQTWFFGAGKQQSNADIVLYNNNMAIQLMQVKKYGLALAHLSKAAAACAEDADNICCFLLESVFYNAGLCHLLAGRTGAVPNYAHAVKCLLSCQQTLQGSPILWIRIAEACVGELSQRIAMDGIQSCRKKEDTLLTLLKQGSAGISTVRLLQLPTAADAKLDFGSATSSSAAFPTAAKYMECGIAVIQNAILLLREADHQVANSPILQHALLLASYLELLKEDYSLAAKHSAEIANNFPQMNTKQSKISNDVMLVALCYAVEAYCHLNRPAQALKVLQSVSLGDLIENSEVNPAGQRATVDALLVNVCVAHIANDAFKQAQNVANHILTRISGALSGGAAGGATTGTGGPAASPTTPLVSDAFGGQSFGATMAAKCALLIQVYIELAQGNKDRAIQLLGKQGVEPPLVAYQR